MDTLDSAVVPRVNIWAHRRSPTLDRGNDHARVPQTWGQVLRPAVQLSVGGREFVRLDVLRTGGLYQSQWVTTTGDYLIGFDFRANSADELQQLVTTIPSLHFD